MPGKVKKIFVTALLVVLSFCLSTQCVLPSSAKQKKKTGGGPDSVLLENNVTVYSTYMYTNKELKYLTCIIQAEAGNQPYRGKVAVANVVLNRVDSSRFPDTIKGVIYENNGAPQFTPTVNGSMSQKLRNYKKMSQQTRECQKAAKAALAGTNVVGDKLFFCVFDQSVADRAGEGNWEKIGAHIFYNLN